MGRNKRMKTANKILSTTLSLGLILSPIASVGAKDASKEMLSPQKARVGTGTTAGQSDDDDDGLKAGYIVSGIAAAAILALIIELSLDGKKDRGVTPPGGQQPPTTTTTTTTTTSTTTSSAGN